MGRRAPSGFPRAQGSPFERYRILSFDCYGTLIDWESGIAAALRPWAERRGLAVDDEELVAAFGQLETVVEQEKPHDLYPSILAGVLRRMGERFGVEVTEEEAAAFGASVADWPAFPDTPPALRALKGRYALAILSNVDRASFALTNRRLGVEFDLVVTAEDVGSYKPDPANFARLLEEVERLGFPTDTLLHVAESLYHDHQPARAAGIDSVWIHRRRGKQGTGATHPPTGPVSPAWTFASMEELAAAALG